jgi:hypothetical protein
MTAADPTGVVAGEPHAHRSSSQAGLAALKYGPIPQRIPGSTLGADAVAEAVVQRAARRIEGEGTR